MAYEGYNPELSGHGQEFGHELVFESGWFFETSDTDSETDSDKVSTSNNGSDTDSGKGSDTFKVRTSDTPSDSDTHVGPLFVFDGQNDHFSSEFQEW